MKKAQGMSLKVVIVAAIALIVLVVLVLIFSGRMGKVTKGTSETSKQYDANKCAIPGTGRQCMDKSSCESQGGSWDNRGGEGYSDCYGTGCCSM